MTDFNINDEQTEKIKERFGKDKVELAQNIEKALKDGDPTDYVGKNLNPKQSALLQKILSDKQSADRFFASEQAQKLLKKILGDKQ